MKKFVNDFYGYEISDYGKSEGFVDFLTVKKYSNAVRNDKIMELTEETIGHWYHICGDESKVAGLNAFYIIDSKLANLLCCFDGEQIFHNREFGMYVWGVYHEKGGLNVEKEWIELTLTSIPCNRVEM